jgi:hypothetical protein
VLLSLVIEVEELVAPGGTDIQGVQLQLLKGLNDYVEVGGARGWTRARARTSSPYVVTKKSMLPKRMCMSGTQLPPWLAIRGLLKMMRRTKGPYLVCQLSMFRTTD